MLGRGYGLTSLAKTVALAAAIFVFAVSPASAGGWLEQQEMPINPTGIDFDADGNATAIGLGPELGVGIGNAISTVERPAGGDWSERIDLPGATSLSNFRPRIDMNSIGDATAIWAKDDMTVQVSYRPRGGSWSAPMSLSEDAVYFPDHHVVIDEEGNATAVWSEFNGLEPPNNHFVVRAAHRPHDGGWSVPEDLSDPMQGTAKNSVLTVDGSGNVTALWVGKAEDEDLGENAAAVRSRTLTAGEAEWGDVQEVALGVSLTQTSISADKEGNVAAVWVQDAGPDAGIRGAYRAVGNPDGWDGAETLGDGNAPQVAIDQEGEAIAVWAQGNAAMASARPAGDDWSDPITLSDEEKTGVVISPGVTFDSSGTATAIWGRTDGALRFAETARNAGNGWELEQDLVMPDSLSEIPTGAMDAQGHVTLAWFAGASSGASRVLDFVAPELRDIAVPDTGMLGQPVLMSVNPFDVWSDVDVTWTFGDGGSPISGNSTKHIYSAVGKHTKLKQARRQVAKIQRRLNRPTSKRRAIALRKAKRRWHVTVRQRRVALRRANARVQRHCR